jgi:alkanesulfonate monooxygenase SsuD/methylene tetrahydromethanopterin reductase-like flavin-dependent oxidoreductase (luciferase family)
MNLQSDQTTKERMYLYRSTMFEAGFDEEAVARCVDDSWVWRNIFVADTDAEAEAIAVPHFRAMRAYLSGNRARMNTEEERAAQAAAVTGAARDSIDHGLIFGSPETVRQRLEEVDNIGIGGIIIHFRLGSMPYADTEHSLRLFAEKVAPHFKRPDNEHD